MNQKTLNAILVNHDKEEANFAEQMETVVLPSDSVQKLIALAHHAIMLEKWLGENLGQNDEWPMQLIASTEEVKADGECMRQLMRWQIETFGNPYGDGNEIL